MAERSLDMGEVVGPIPTARTIYFITHDKEKTSSLIYYRLRI